MDTTSKGRKSRGRRADDERMNPELRREVVGLRGAMEVAAERNPLPARFEARRHDSEPAMVVRDTQTGRCVTVGLFAYGEVRSVLAALFPGES